LLTQNNADSISAKHAAAAFVDLTQQPMTLYAGITAPLQVTVTVT